MAWLSAREHPDLGRKAEEVNYLCHLSQKISHWIDTMEPSQEELSWLAQLYAHAQFLCTIFLGTRVCEPPLSQEEISFLRFKARLMQDITYRDFANRDFAHMYFTLRDFANSDFAHSDPAS